MPTPTKGLEQPANGSFVNIWDQPVNNNMSIIDASFGGVATIALGGANVTLTQAQYQCAMIRLTGAISTNIAVIFPALGGLWTISNECTNQSSFYIYAYNGGSGLYVGLPPGVSDIMGDGTFMRHRSLPPIGSYMMLAGNVYQPWMQIGSPTLPYLNCDGSGIPGQYVQLIQMIGGSLPDLRGRCFFNTDQGTGRLTSVLGSVYTHAGGDQWMQSHNHGAGGGTFSENQAHNHNYTVNVNGIEWGPGQVVASLQQTSATGGGVTGTENQAHDHGISVSVFFNGNGGWQNIPPAIIGGLTFIRAGG